MFVIIGNLHQFYIIVLSLKIPETTRMDTIHTITLKALLHFNYDISVVRRSYNTKHVYHTRYNNRYRIHGYCKRFLHTLIKCFLQLANIKIPPPPL